MLPLPPPCRQGPSGPLLPVRLPRHAGREQRGGGGGKKLSNNASGNLKTAMTDGMLTWLTPYRGVYTH